jgi:hypothetical protein
MAARIMLLIGCALFAAHGTAWADTLLLDEIDAAQATAERPARGMTKARVEARFGAPDARRGAIGDPPISRWEYPGFVVYFEHDHVIHAVFTRRPS